MALTWTRSSEWDSDDWRKVSACRDTDPDLFFPIGTTGQAIEQIEAAKAVCFTCEVRDACLGICPRDQPGVRRLGRNVGRRAAQAPKGVARSSASPRFLNPD